MEKFAKMIIDTDMGPKESAEFMKRMYRNGMKDYCDSFTEFVELVSDAQYTILFKD